MRSALTLLAILLCFCSCSSPQIQPQTTSEQAIEVAIRGCTTLHSQQVGPLSATEARLTTIHEANQLLGEDFAHGNTESPAWLVILEGTWQIVGGPEPQAPYARQFESPLISPVVLHVCYALVDANTNQFLGLLQRLKRTSP